MNCQFCGKQLPQASTGKRELQYCRTAHKKASEHHRQLQEARLRIRLLERIIQRSGLTLRFSPYSGKNYEGYCGSTFKPEAS
jgi:hypothetical protein